MVFHPPGIVVEIVGTEVGDQAARAKSTLLTAARCWSQNVVVRLLKVQLMVGIWCKPGWPKNS